MYNLRKKTPINGQVIKKVDVKIPPNLRQIFEVITNQVLYQRIIPELNRRVTEYQEWIFEEEKKAEQILRDSGYVLPRKRTQNNHLQNDFINLLGMIDENEKCYAINSMTKRKVQFRSNPSRHWGTNSSSSNNDCNNLSLLPAIVAKGVRNFCVKRITNAVCRKKEIVKAVVEKTRKFREDSQSRVKQHKKQLEKEDEERRKHSLIKIKQQAVNAAANRERKRHKLSVTPIAKRTRSAHNATPIAERLRSKTKETEPSKQENGQIVPINIMLQHRGRIKMKKKTEKKEAIHYDTMNRSTSPMETSVNQIACIKSDLETTILSELKTAISEESNIEATLSSKFDSNVLKIKDSSKTETAILDSDKDMEQNHTGIEFADVLKSCHASQLSTSENSSKQNDDANIHQPDNSLSMSLTSNNTASILERTRPGNKSIDFPKRSTCVIHRGEMHEVDDVNVIHKGTKRSTYLIRDLKYERNITSDDFRVMSMDMRSSSSHQSKTIMVHATDGDVIKGAGEKRGKVTSTRFPGRQTLEKLVEQELARIRHSEDADKRIEEEETDYEIYDLLSNDETDSNEKSCKKIPSWANEENVRQILEKQQIWSQTNIDSLFGKIHPPDMQKMFGDALKIRSATRSSSAMWESPIWNPRVGYSAYHFTFQQTENQECNNVRRSQRVKKPVSYLPFF
ncbi:unnamed protein product [Cercopithifilaria johnstoni]|uniref:Inner centromere protein ARK-binding domain-containing protein n=1 Tax=Cercopithifilaria johnstoni TaxID=2874296 RepID=A0A8J2MMJ9_9BILA|nr:unnamed protein product [Cercopithifilaria johnstoni]